VAYYEDLSPCTYFGVSAPLVAVGWLEQGRPVPTGSVDSSVFERLFDLLESPLQPMCCWGWHSCDLCSGNVEGLMSSIAYRAERRVLGIDNVFVPGDGRLYVAPSLILHYIAEHGYAPPQEFQEAVLHCPQMGSADYLAAVAELGVPLDG
jgi:hypothetical protein